MKYKSDIPNLFIMGDVVFDNGSRERVELGKFDENGELETDNQILIQRLKELGFTPIEETGKEEIKNDETEIVCKKCGKAFDNKGLLMAHYKSDHPKK